MMRKLHSVYVIVVVLILSVFLSGCLGGTLDVQADFEKIMNAFKTADKTEIDKVYNISEVMSFIDDTDDEIFADAIISTLSKMDYKINSVERTSSTAVKLNVNITTVDYSEIVKSYIDKVVKLVNSNEYKELALTIGEEEYKKLMAEQMVEAIEEYSGETITKTVDVTMTKSGEKWKISGDSEELLGALFSNLTKSVESVM